MDGFLHGSKFNIRVARYPPHTVLARARNGCPLLSAVSNFDDGLNVMKGLRHLVMVSCGMWRGIRCMPVCQGHGIRPSQGSGYLQRRYQGGHPYGLLLYVAKYPLHTRLPGGCLLAYRLLAGGSLLCRVAVRMAHMTSRDKHIPEVSRQAAFAGGHGCQFAAGRAKPCER